MQTDAPTAGQNAMQASGVRVCWDKFKRHSLKSHIGGHIQSSDKTYFLSWNYVLHLWQKTSCLILSHLLVFLRREKKIQAEKRKFLFCTFLISSEMLWGNALPAKYYQPVSCLVYMRPLLCWNESAHSRNIIMNDFCIAFDKVISTHVYKAWVLSLFMTGFRQQVKVGRKKWTVCRQTPAFLSTQWAGLKAHTDTGVHGLTFCLRFLSGCLFLNKTSILSL